MDERESMLALSSFIPFGPARLKLLLEFFGSAKIVWSLDKSDLLKVGLKEKLTESFFLYKKSFKEAEYFQEMKRMEINFVVNWDKTYPQNLKDIDDAPAVLYYIGKIGKIGTDCVAIVGSRKMTGYGKSVAYDFSSKLAGLGIVIVSGLAIGIDTVAHDAALKAGGRSVAVLATGLDAVVPLRNRWLAAKIVEQNGCLISEYPLHYPAFKINFARRNRIISGLSKAVVVIEGEQKSGTLLTASAAGDQGKQVFAVPGQISSPMSAAPHFLIKNGAKMATDVKDILEELDMQLKVDKETVESIMPQTPDEKLITSVITREAMHMDEVARITGMAVSDISARLTIMELKGIVKNIGNGIYKKS